MEDQIVFDERECVDFIFNKLIEKGIAVSTEDIQKIVDLEYEYGESINLYPPKDVNGRPPAEVKVLIQITDVDGATQLHCEYGADESIELLKEAIETIRTFD